MLANIISWIKNLSVIGKVGLGTAATVGTVSLANATPPVQQPDMESTRQSTESKVETNVPVVTTKEVTETEPVSFERRTENNSSLENGKTQIKQIGVDGVKTKIYKVTYTDGRETNKELVSEKITSEPVDEITYVGTYVAPKPSPALASNCDPNYAGGCVPNVSYDLDCGDIGFSVRVIGTDKHRFDRDHDGYGCESY